MTQKELDGLIEIVHSNQPWFAHKLLLDYVKNAEVTEEVKGTRTGAQNRALHTYFTMVSDALNDAGLDIRAVIKEEVEIPWTPENVKEYLWKPVQKLAVQKEHTRELTKAEVSEVWEIFNRHIAKHGVFIDFPHELGKENIRLKAVENLTNTNYPVYEGTPTF